MAKETSFTTSVGKLPTSGLRPLLHALVLLGWTLVVCQCQDVEYRGLANQQVGEKSSGDSAAAIRASNGATSSRGVYSPRLAYGPHHQIMHFGKRPANALPSRAYDLYWQQKQRQQQAEQAAVAAAAAAAAANKFPWTYKMDQGQQMPMEPLEEELTAFEFAEPVVNSRMPIYSIISQPVPSEQTSSGDSFSVYETMPTNLVNRLLQQANMPQQQQSSMAVNKSNKFSSRLMSNNADSDDSSNETSDAGNQSVDQSAVGISVATRSPHSTGRTSGGGLGSGSSNSGKSYISTLLLGRASTPSMGGNFGGFIKKAEPKDNVFMHFGRK